MIRKLLKWFIYLCLLMLAGVVLLLLCKDIIIRNLTEQRILHQTGMYVRIDRLHVGFTEPVISMEGFKLYNRPEFGGGLLLHVPDLYIEYDPRALKSGELHVNQLRLDVRELNIVRNAGGQTNIVDFIERAGTVGRKALSRKLPARNFGFTGIDRLDLSLGRIRYFDLRNPRRNREAYFGLQHLEIKNIRNEDDLYGVAAMVLIRSGLLSLGMPADHEHSPKDSLLDLGLNWLMERLGMDAPPSRQVMTNASTIP